MHSPMYAHFKMVKLILRYVKGTVEFGLHFNFNSILDLYVFLGSNWARCSLTWWSTIGYYLFLDSSYISWSKKSKMLSLARALMLSAEPWLKLLLSSLGSLFFFVTWASSYQTPRYYFAIILVPFTWQLTLFFMLAANISRLTNTMYVNVEVLNYFIPDMSQHLCNLSIFLQNHLVACTSWSLASYLGLVCGDILTVFKHQ